MPLIALQQLEEVPFALTFSIVYPAETGAADLLGSAGALIFGVAETAGAAFTATPLFQTSLPLFLIQVNLRPATVETCPAFLHAAPALTAADDAGAPTSAIANATTNENREIFIAPV